MTVYNIDQWDNSSEHVLKFYTSNFGRLSAYWSVDDINPVLILVRTNIYVVT